MSLICWKKGTERKKKGCFGSKKRPGSEPVIFQGAACRHPITSSYWANSFRHGLFLLSLMKKFCLCSRSRYIFLSYVCCAPSLVENLFNGGFSARRLPLRARVFVIMAAESIVAIGLLILDPAILGCGAVDGAVHSKSQVSVQAGERGMPEPVIMLASLERISPKISCNYDVKLPGFLTSCMAALSTYIISCTPTSGIFIPQAVAWSLSIPSRSQALALSRSTAFWTTVADKGSSFHPFRLRTRCGSSSYPVVTPPDSFLPF